jgi:hypothetical protein
MSGRRGSLMASLRRTSEAAEQRVLELKHEGRPQRAIAAELKMPPATVAAILKRSPEYESPRANGGRISAYRAAQKHGLKVWTLCGAIDVGIVRGQVTVSGKRRFYTVDPDEFEEDLAKRAGRRCTYPGCTGEALVLSIEQRCFSHTGDVKLPGHAPKDSQERARMTAGKVGIERPDVAERYRHDWRRGGPLTRGLFYDEEGKVKPYFKGSTRQRHLGRQNAAKPPAPGAPPRGRPRAQLTAEQTAEARRLSRKSPKLGRTAIAGRLGVSEWAVRKALPDAPD